MADECTLEKCIELYTATEKMEGDNMILNDKTNKKEVAEKKIQFWSLPEVLVITLKRFSNNNRKNQRGFRISRDKTAITFFIKK